MTTPRTVLKESTPDTCRNCGYPPQWRPRWRPKIDDRGNRIYEGKFLLLEQTERLICACSAKAVYIPIAGVAPEQCEWSEPPATKRR